MHARCVELAEAREHVGNECGLCTGNAEPLVRAASCVVRLLEQSPCSDIFFVALLCWLVITRRVAALLRNECIEFVGEFLHCVIAHPLWHEVTRLACAL